MKDKILELLNKYTCGVDDGFGGSILCIADDGYDDLATDILRLFGYPSEDEYLFFYEGEEEDGFSFKINANTQEEAFDKAYDLWGPQVEGMMYKLIT